VLRYINSRTLSLKRSHFSSSKPQCVSPLQQGSDTRLSQWRVDAQGTCPFTKTPFCTTGHPSSLKNISGTVGEVDCKSRLTERMQHFTLHANSKENVWQAKKSVPSYIILHTRKLSGNVPVSHCFPYQRPECWKVLRAIDKTEHCKNKPTSSTATSMHNRQEPRLCQPPLLAGQTAGTLHPWLVHGFILQSYMQVHRYVTPARTCFGFLKTSVEHSFCTFISSCIPLFCHRRLLTYSLSYWLQLPTPDLTSCPREQVGAPRGVVSGSSPHLVAHACLVFLRLQNSACSPGQWMPVDSLILCHQNVSTCYLQSSLALPLGRVTVLPSWHGLSFLEADVWWSLGCKMFVGLNSCERKGRN